MILNKFFSLRVKQLRLSHNLSLAQLAFFLGKKKSSLSEIEAGRNGATIDGLIDFSNLFAVSTDWLIGVSDIPYRIDIIENLENELLESVHDVNCLSWIAENETYKNRTLTLSLPVRANIIFSLKAISQTINQRPDADTIRKYRLTSAVADAEFYAYLHFLVPVIRYLYSDEDLLKWASGKQKENLRLDPKTPIFNLVEYNQGTP